MMATDLLSQLLGTKRACPRLGAPRAEVVRAPALVSGAAAPALSAATT